MDTLPRRARRARARGGARDGRTGARDADTGRRGGEASQRQSQRPELALDKALESERESESARKKHTHTSELTYLVTYTES